MGEVRKVLLVTSRLAQDVVRDAVKRAVRSGRAKYEVEVITLPMDVAALMTTEYVAEYLKRVGISAGKYDLIVVPGLVRGSCRVIEESVGVRAVKGTVYAADIPVLLTFDLSKLSSEEPADRVLAEHLRAIVTDVLSEVEGEVTKKGYVRVGNVLVPVRPPPMRIIAEVTEAHLYGREQLLSEVSRLINEGADIVSLGFEAGNPNPDRIREILKFLKREIDAPLAVDSVIPSEISAAAGAGADMILSLTRDNIPEVAEYVRDLPTVVIPQGGAGIPKDPAMRVSVLEDNIELARKYGVRNVIADLVLDPPVAGATLRSLMAYYEFKQKNPDIPILMGVGNVTEFIDADSVGVNALMTVLALEAGASMLLTVEKSVKARGSTFEVATASQMASIAWVRRSPPKDLGLDLLILKDKRRVSTPLISGEGVKVVSADGVVGAELRHTGLDPMGIFKIRVDHERGVIEALYIGRKGRILIRGKRAKTIMNYILSNGLVSMLSHATYLGAELAKAEEALRLGKNYVQEEPLFREREFLKVSKKRLA